MEVELLSYGDVLFGVVNGHPPARWRYVGRDGTAATLEHVPAGGQTPFPPQVVTVAKAFEMRRSHLWGEEA